MRPYDEDRGRFLADPLETRSIHYPRQSGTNQISSVTIYDVAKRAGVSTATISRVLSRPEVVASATRDRVMRVVNQLGFAPNSNAKNLRKQATAKLLVTVPDLSNPFFSLILQGIRTLPSGTATPDRGRHAA